MRKKHGFERLHDVLYANATMSCLLLLFRYAFENTNEFIVFEFSSKFVSR